jgi:hypothetical protein
MGHGFSPGSGESSPELHSDHDRGGRPPRHGSEAIGNSGVASYRTTELQNFRRDAEHTNTKKSAITNYVRSVRRDNWYAAAQLSFGIRTAEWAVRVASRRSRQACCSALNNRESAVGGRRSRLILDRPAVFVRATASGLQTVTRDHVADV